MNPASSLEDGVDHAPKAPIARGLVELGLNAVMAAATPMSGLLLLLYVAHVLAAEDLAIWSSAAAVLGLVSAGLAPYTFAGLDLGRGQLWRHEELLPILASATRAMGGITLLCCAFAVTLRPSPLWLALVSFALSGVCRSFLEATSAAQGVSGNHGIERILRAAPATFVLVAAAALRVRSICTLLVVSAAAQAACVLLLTHLTRPFAVPSLSIRATASGMLSLYRRYLNGTRLAVASLGIFSFPMLVFAAHAPPREKAAFGLCLQLIMPTSAFFALVMSRRLREHAAALLDGPHPPPPLTAAIVATSGALALSIVVVVAGWQWSKGLQVDPMLLVSLALLAGVELTQSYMTGVLMRLSTKGLEFRAAISGCVICCGAYLANSAFALLLLSAAAQGCCFLLPNIRRLGRR